MDILNTVFMNVLLVTFTSSIIAVVILLIRYLFKTKINIRFNQILLSFILLRFCMLIVPESSISILNLLPQYGTENTISGSLSTIHPHIKSQQTTINDIGKKTQIKYSQNTDKHLDTPNINTEQVKHRFSIINILSIIWLAGVLIILVGSIIIQKRFIIRLKSCKQIDDSDLIIIIDKCKKILGIKRNVNIYMGDNLTSPLITDLFKPNVYIPKQMINVDQEHFQHVILHELAHYKRKDLIYNILSVIAVGIHWFNPIIWKITSIIKSDIELACDTYVLDKLGEDNAISYGESILIVTRLFLTRRNQIELACYFSNTKKQLERRIIMINNFKKNTYKFTALSIMIALLIGGIVLTNPVKTKAQEPQMKFVENKDIVEELIEPRFRYYKEYNDLDRLLKDVDFNILIPEYIIEDDYNIECIQFIPEEGRVNFFNSINNGFYFNINISKTHPEFYLLNKAYNSNPSIINRYFINFEGIEGEVIEISIGGKIVTKHKHLVFEKDDIYYDIEYKVIDQDNNVIGEIDLLEVAKMIKSLKDPEDINKDNFIIPYKTTHIYRMEDMKEARENVGFDFKFPIDNKYRSISIINEKIILISDSEYNYSLSIEKKEPYYYNQFNEHGKINNDNEKMIKRLEANWEYIKNKKVLKLITTFNNSDQRPFEKTADESIQFIWEDNDIYYNIVFSSFANNYNKTEMEKIIKHIMDSNSFDEIIKENGMN
ncbi:M56 family metallopeptidase [Vallitalea maricola]|uniref:Uncharacterized protein n=1 Tax=Vallitalea maricola TaxID=3074433 RepID=A0ACB5UG29_9FIRM|nr:hypothetical protein AN2V17_08410 [Vallitalea sp. AN17-2]